jgi:hypothetical protein
MREHERQSAAPSTAPSPPGRPSTSLFLGWRDARPLLARLKGGGRMASSAVARLQRTARLQLGTVAHSWSYWIELGEWLEADTPTRSPPRFPPTVFGSLGDLEDRLVFRYIDRDGNITPDGRAAPDLLARCLRSLGANADDGRHWLTLGRALELDDLPAAGRTCYTYGLPRLAGRSLKSMALVTWQGLWRATLLDPARPPERELWRHWHETGGVSWFWGSAEMVLADSGAYDRALDAGMAAPATFEEAACRRAQRLAVHFRGPEALALAQRVLERNPKSPAAHGFMVDYAMKRGRVAEARAHEAHVGRYDTAPGQWFDYFAQPAGTPPPQPVPRLASSFDASWEIFRRLEAKDVAAVRLIEKLERTSHGTLPRPTAEMAFMLLDAGIDRPELVRTCEELLDERALDPAIWSPAAGTLRTPGGIALMDRLLARADVRFAGQLQPRLYRALWLSRRGQVEDSLRKLAEALAMQPAEIHCSPVLEILCRPLWRQAAARDAIPKVPAGWDREIGAPACASIDALWNALRHGDRESASARAAAWHELDPAEPVASLLAVWLAGLANDPAGVSSWAARARASLRSFRRLARALDELAELERR